MHKLQTLSTQTVKCTLMNILTLTAGLELICKMS